MYVWRNISSHTSQTMYVWRNISSHTSQTMYVWRSIEAPSCNHCCSGTAISITYSECAFVSLGIQHAMRMRLIILSSVADLSGSTTYSHIISQTARTTIGGQSLNTNCVSFSLQHPSQHFSFWEELSQMPSQMYASPHVQCRYSCHTEPDAITNVRQSALTLRHWL
jgi:hypothetical protein